MKRDRSTRYEILNLLKKNGRMTAKQVGDELGLTAMGARQHLMSLERDSLVSSEFVRQKAGRPALYFALTNNSEKFFPQQYSSLAVGILRNLEEMEGREKIGELLKHRRVKLEKLYKEELNGADIKDQVQKLAQMRDESGYMAEVEEREDGIYLKEYNCPIHDVAKEYPEVCNLELELFQDLIDGNVERVEHLIKGKSACVYKILDTKKRKMKKEKE